MRILLKSPVQEAIGSAEQGDFSLLLTGEEPTERVIERVAALGMRRQGVHTVRLEGEDCGRLAELAVRAFFHGAYRISKDALRAPIQNVFAARDALCDYGAGALCVDCEQDVSEGVRRGLLMARCEGYARTLGNLPNNFLHVRQMAEYLSDMARDSGMICRVMHDDDLRELGCGGILAANQGSTDEANLVVLEHRPKEAQNANIALVGKGVMFDTGGYHLKNADGMNGMHCDMCGAAIMAEVMEFFARAGRTEPIMAVLPLAENVISANAVKMGDVISTLAGKTVEIYNTDAEGRLLLCDALTYAQRMGAKVVIDLATLTYGCQSALGDDVGGYFCNDENLAAWTETAAAASGEEFWRLPLAERYHQALKWSECADLANYAPGYGAAASTAACFLEEFIEPGVKWLHLDVVGPSVRRGAHDAECKGARGFGLPFLSTLLLPAKGE